MTAHLALAFLASAILASGLALAVLAILAHAADHLPARGRRRPLPGDDLGPTRDLIYRGTRVPARPEDARR